MFSCTFEVKLINVEIVLLPHYFINAMQCTSTSGSKTAKQHDATTTVLDSLYSVIGFKSLTLTPQNILHSYHCVQIALSHLILKPFSRRDLDCLMLPTLTSSQAWRCLFYWSPGSQ
ncbi:hypothetical protein CHARACLAT_019148 [Characodon lateralis]|uniref:Uncharacterized protein n=1 Tax=Characodon lateralis TaxID=208331 RepID=A0ABU7ELN8_9TELE|nr:hypothetical protein [Characodon lateralis]